MKLSEQSKPVVIVKVIETIMIWCLVFLAWDIIAAAFLLEPLPLNTYFHSLPPHEQLDFHREREFWEYQMPVATIQVITFFLGFWLCLRIWFNDSMLVQLAKRMSK